MKHAIFLLALCAFQKVFAPFPARVRTVNDLNLFYFIQMKGIMSSFHIDFKNKLEKGQRENILVRECMTEYNDMQSFYNEKEIERQECYQSAQTHGNLQVADKCYETPFAALQSKAYVKRGAVEQCLSDILAGREYIPRVVAGPSAPNQPHTG